LPVLEIWQQNQRIAGGQEKIRTAEFAFEMSAEFGTTQVFFANRRRFTAAVAQTSSLASPR
jgi:hypothetical protein